VTFAFDGVGQEQLGPGVGIFAEHDQPCPGGPPSEVDQVAALDDFGAAAAFACGLDSGLPVRFGGEQQGVADTVDRCGSGGCTRCCGLGIPWTATAVYIPAVRPERSATSPSHAGPACETSISHRPSPGGRTSQPRILTHHKPLRSLGQVYVSQHAFSQLGGSFAGNSGITHEQSWLRPRAALSGAVRGDAPSGPVAGL